jgi:MoaA/NifB/PqqE/SkfB family radical SAM enzyme
MMINVVKWDITYNCNLECLHCDRYLCRGLFKEMNTEEALAVLDRLKEMGAREIVLSGGEPILRKDIFQIIEYALDKRMNVYLSTNGTLLTGEISEKIVSLGVKEVMISFDGSTAQTHDTMRGKKIFDQVKKNAKLLTDAIRNNNGKTIPRMNTVLTALNLEDAAGFVDLAHEIGFRELVLFHLMNWGNTRINSQKLIPDPSQHLRALETIARKSQLLRLDTSFALTLSLYPLRVVRYLEEKYHLGWNASGGPCSGGIDVIHITPNGLVSPCDGGFHTVLAEKEKEEGKKTSEFAQFPHILEDSVEDILNSNLFTQLILLFHNPRIYLDTIPCASCEDRSNCGICPTTVIQNRVISLCQEVERIVKKN